MNDHAKELYKTAMQRKAAEAINHLHELPVVICSGGSISFESTLIFKRESAITSASGNEEYTPMQTHRCNKCGKLIPWAKDIGKIPDIFISDCEMMTTDSPDHIAILAKSLEEPEEKKNWADKLFGK